MNSKAEAWGLLGGTFNPVHCGHLLAARAAAEALGLHRLLLLPNACSPLRQGEEMASPGDRLEMVRLAVAETTGLGVCDLEVRRPGPSYLIDTLRELRAAHPGVDFTFLMGVDSLRSFDRWREAAQIPALARVVVMPRPGDDAAAALTALESRAPALRGRIHLLTEGPRLDISATDIRDRIREGRSVRDLLPEAVADYIRTRGLYLK
jgi:nicotinate-nucleotide adenylyltransferase